MEEVVVELVEAILVETALMVGETHQQTAQRILAAGVAVISMEAEVLVVADPEL